MSEPPGASQDGVEEEAKIVAADPRPIDHIFRWDLDKTYLQTDFDRVRDLVRTALQKPEEKRNVPGAMPLLLALLRDNPERRRLVYFVSGSPTQMRKVLEKKLALDGIKPHAFILKPNLENILKLRFRAVRAQVGYKLRALLEHQIEGPPIPETLFGDDAEQDAAIYSIYAEVVAGRLRGDALNELLKAGEVYAHNAEAIMAASEQIEPGERVQRIFINLDRRSPLSHFSPYSPRLVAVHNHLQAPLVIYPDRLITARDVFRIGLEMMARDGFNATQLTGSVQDLARRGLLVSDGAERLREALRGWGGEGEALAKGALLSLDTSLGLLKGYEAQPPTAPERLDLAGLLRRELAARKQHKEALKQRALDDALDEDGEEGAVEPDADDSESGEAR